MITIEHLSKSFSGNKVLDDLSLTIEQGEVVALIGASGAGKSTFLRSLNYLEEPVMAVASSSSLTAPPIWATI